MLAAFENAAQHTGPTMIFELEQPGGGRAKQYVNLDGEFGVRTTGFGIPPPWESRSSPRSYDFDAHAPVKSVGSARHQHESPGGVPYSNSHRAGMQRARAARQREVESPRDMRSRAINNVANPLLAGETARAMKFDDNQVRAKTPDYRRGSRSKIGQNRLSVTSDRPNVGKTANPLYGPSGRGSNIDKDRKKYGTTAKIPINTVTQDAFQASTAVAREEGKRMRAFMRARRPDMVDYDDSTVQASRTSMLNTVKANADAYNSEQNAMKRGLLSSHLTKECLENHIPQQDMVYNHANEATMRRT